MNRVTGARAPLVAAVTCALLLAACSGGESPASGTSAEQTTGSGSSSGPADSGTTTGDAATETDAPDTGVDTDTTTGEPPTSAPDGATAPTGEQGIGLPSAAGLEAARADVAGLSDRELAGQLVVGAYSGTDSAAAAALVQENHLGGLITLGGNVPESVDARVPALTALTASVQQAVAADGRDWPAFLAIDQEGGAITRVGAPLDHWPAGMALGAARDPALAREVAQASGEQLRALGYTVVLAPVADVTSGPEDPTIGSRSPGSDPGVVATVATAQVIGFAQAGILPVAKHFPGHGTIPADSHVGVAEQTADLALLEERDLVPFRAVVGAGAPAIMPGHIVVDALDADRPATISHEVITGLLREDLGFGGLVVTDALNMGAITQGGSTDHPAVQALLAGVDVLLMPPDPRGTVDAIVFALEDGTLQRADLEESAARMVALLRHQQQVPAPDLSVIGSDHELSVRAAAAGITQLSGPCGERLVGDSITIAGGTETDRAALAAAAEAAGLGTGSGDRVVLVGGANYRAGGGSGGPGTGTGDVVVTTDRPYPLADSTASTALIAAYGRDPATMEALVQVLLGEAEATGTLSTPVGDFAIGAGCH
ncbi:beta-N-acetylhexosaminidase [Ornithinimicrobium sp. F0845]|uniref:glycoside hydrolase family 3 protein n=1 Tax=Ornithinimicrobium sp. F0845 TaxID=2926412 RepID=UPI001FF431B0|nr:glycoside hydrolase family 3 N-terminal domain-containing protein [Ornithinimicrobium sp. F0845]MCK0111132.1 beta-N-acetylhexosaminidase [Ornithinimicrobium sp. F0845]